MARLLAERLLAAKDLDEVAGAFSDIYVESMRRAGKDENELRIAKLDAEVKKAVFKGEIAISDLKHKLDE